MLDLTKIRYEEFNNSIEDLNWRLDLIIDCGDWQILKDKKSGKFFVNEHSCNDFYEVRPIAKLEYDVTNDIQCTYETLFNMFDWDKYDFCGEQVAEDKIVYWWFKDVLPELN